MELLNRNAILSADDIKRVDVPVPEWGGTVRVRTMTAKERDAMMGESVLGDDGKPNMENFRSKFLVRCIVGADDKPLFSAADIEALGAKSGAALERVYKQAETINDVTEEKVAEAKGN